MLRIPAFAFRGRRTNAIIMVKYGTLENFLHPRQAYVSSNLHAATVHKNLLRWFRYGRSFDGLSGSIVEIERIALTAEPQIRRRKVIWLCVAQMENFGSSF